MSKSFPGVLEFNASVSLKNLVKGGKIDSTGSNEGQ